MSWTLRVMAALCMGALVACAPVDDGRSAFRKGEVPVPAANPPSAAKVELGRSLFFDARLSGDGSRSCATCHKAHLGWGDGLPRAEKLAGGSLPLRTPTLLNLAWGERMGWDGKFADVESVAFGPITNKDNMGSSEGAVLAAVAADGAYPAAFAAAFGDGEVSRPRVEAALGSFVRSLVSGETRFDRWVGGDDAALTGSERRGFSLFTGKAGCAGCHSGWAMSDGSFHDVGTGGDTPGRGRFFPGSVRLEHAWKTPGLREVGRRAPYMHDGSLATLEAVVDHYDRGGGTDRPSLSARVRPLGLAAGEKADLAAFLRTLDSEEPETTGPADATAPKKATE